MVMTQTAPTPEDLLDLVARLTYREGWWFELRDDDRGQWSVGYTFIVHARTVNSYAKPEGDRREVLWVEHKFPVPPAAYDRRSWQRWLLEQLFLVERHEAMEFFTIDGEKPYAPNHGPGNDPYIVRELSTDVDRRTAFTGVVNPS